MTLHELLDEVKTHTTTRMPEPQVLSLLNRAMHRIARDLGIPRLHIDVNGITGEFELSEATIGYDVREVMGAYRDDAASTPLPLYSALEANRLHRGWKNWSEGTTQFLIYDPSVLGLGTATLVPVPTPPEDDPESYVLTCVVRPNPLAQLSDEPFNGLLPEYHQMLAHYVISELQIMAGDERAGFHRSVYEELKRDAFIYSRPDGSVYSNARTRGYWS